jgi:hypothetical protein
VIGNPDRIVGEVSPGAASSLQGAVGLRRAGGGSGPLGLSPGLSIWHVKCKLHLLGQGRGRDSEEEAAMTEAGYGDTARAGEREIDRKDTGIRILLTILFVLIWGVVESVLGLIILFALLWALITKQPPAVGVRALANRIITYYYRIGRYLTYNESLVPFPFSDFPEALEESRWTPEPRESESLGRVRPAGDRREPEREATDD